MADPISTEDFTGISGAGCAHDKVNLIVLAVDEFMKNAPANTSQNVTVQLKAKLESKFPGQTITAAKCLKALSSWVAVQ